MLTVIVMLLDEARPRYGYAARSAVIVRNLGQSSLPSAEPVRYVHNR
jgi:hypothetical protein